MMKRFLVLALMVLAVVLFASTGDAYTTYTTTALESQGTATSGKATVLGSVAGTVLSPAGTGKFIYITSAVISNQSSTIANTFTIISGSTTTCSANTETISHSIAIPASSTVTLPFMYPFKTPTANRYICIGAGTVSTAPLSIWIRGYVK